MTPSLLLSRPMQSDPAQAVRLEAVVEEDPRHCCGWMCLGNSHLLGLLQCVPADCELRWEEWTGAYRFGGRAFVVFTVILLYLPKKGYNDSKLI